MHVSYLNRLVPFTHLQISLCIFPCVMELTKFPIIVYMNLFHHFNPQNDGIMRN